MNRGLRASLVLLVCSGLVCSGCTTTRWHYDTWVPYGPESEIDRHELEQFAAASCPISDLLTPRFVSDGCSYWPDGDWGGCCVAHDLAYWCGGSREARREADRALKQCLVEAGHPVMGSILMLGVRVTGHPSWPFSFRWGYGRRWRGRHWEEPASPIPGVPPAHWQAMIY